MAKSGSAGQSNIDQLELGGPHPHHPQRVAVSRRGVVATAHYRASEAGAEMFDRGGNAIDAAVAAAFALGVCEPSASGLGGQTMMLLRSTKTGRTIALDGSSRAPNRASPEAVTAKQRRRGYRSTTVPSTPAALGYALRQYGSLTLAEALAPAIRLAEDGYEITSLQHTLATRYLRQLKTRSAGQVFLRAGNRPYRAGSLFRQPALAETLRCLAAEGIEAFYRGRIARQIHDDMVRNDGLIRDDDLAQIPRPIERRPITCRYNNMRVFTFPPPGAGRTLIQMLNMHQCVPASSQNPDTPAGAVVLAGIIRQAFLDRQDRPYDPSYYPQVVNKRMLSEQRAARLVRNIVRDVSGRGETTHLSAMDRDGNVIVLTQSIERVFGACEVTPELGFLYNNYISAFEHERINHPYYLRPNAAPWASVAPTIVFRGRRPWLAIGSPGSERIAPSILQVLIKLQTHSPLAAVDAPRMHCSIDGTVSLEASRMRTDIPKALDRHGYPVDVRDAHSFYLGCVQLVMRERGMFIGVADPRRDGSAAGPAS